MTRAELSASLANRSSGNLAIGRFDHLECGTVYLVARAKHNFNEPKRASDPAGRNQARPRPRRRVVFRGPSAGQRDCVEASRHGPARKSSITKSEKARRLETSADSKRGCGRFP